ncbi:hypothetical protein Tco_0617444 [Tanacetum coccineum]
MSMTIHSSLKARILVAQNEASKGANSSAKMLKGLDKQFEKKEDGGLYVTERIWVPVYGNLRTLNEERYRYASMQVLGLALKSKQKPETIGDCSPTARGFPKMESGDYH